MYYTPLREIIVYKVLGSDEALYEFSISVMDSSSFADLLSDCFFSANNIRNDVAS